MVTYTYILLRRIGRLGSRSWFPRLPDVECLKAVDMEQVKDNLQSCRLHRLVIHLTHLYTHTHHKYFSSFRLTGRVKHFELHILNRCRGFLHTSQISHWLLCPELSSHFCHYFIYMYSQLLRSALVNKGNGYDFVSVRNPCRCTAGSDYVCTCRKSSRCFLAMCMSTTQARPRQSRAMSRT